MYVDFDMVKMNNCIITPDIWYMIVKSGKKMNRDCDIAIFKIEPKILPKWLKKTA